MIRDTRPSRLLGADGRPYRFGYDAAEASTKRKARDTKLLTEDKHLPAGKRRKLVGTTRDLGRNFAIAAWMARKHLDYVASFSFQSKSKDQGWNTELENFVTRWSRRWNFDAARRHPLRRFIRMSELRRVLDGDFYTLKLRDGRAQALEGDRIRRPIGDLPNGMNPAEWPHGIKTGLGGRTMAYALSKRTSCGMTFERVLSARHVLPLGYYDRFDQVRGISPLAAALHTLQDTYEGFDYALAKAKIAQLFGLVIYRQTMEELGGDVDAVAVAEDDTTTDADESRDRYDVSLGDGPIKLELDGTDRAEFLECKTPSGEFQEFNKTMIMVALKSLDIPYSFYDEKHTNFYGSIAAKNQYIKSCKSKRADLHDLLRSLTVWRLLMAVLDGELTLPSGWTWEDLGGCGQWDWIADGVPWWDPVKECTAATARIEAGFASPQQVCREIGNDFHDNVDQTAEALAYAESKGVTLSFAASPPE